MQQHQHGFTLVELLVSLAILALIAVALAGTFRYGRLSWERTERFDVDTNLASVRQFVRQRLASAQPVNALLPGGRLQLAFDGRHDGATFVALSQGYTETAGLYQTTFDLSAGENGNSALYFSQALFRPDGTGDNKQDRRLLMDNMAAIKFRYFGRLKPQSPRQWQDSWNDATLLPELVEISAKLPADDNRHWNMLVVPLDAADR